MIGREALERSVSPRQKRSKPPPVPETPTVTCTSGFSLWNRSAAAVVYGPTVLEPSASMRPERSLAGCLDRRLRGLLVTAPAAAGRKCKNG